MNNPWKSNVEREVKMTITPAIAEEMLKYEILGNRETRRHTDTIAVAMVNDDFVYMADPIRFVSDGRMVDGGNRLRAIIKSDTTQEVLIAMGLKESIIPYLNHGSLNRDGGDVLQIMTTMSHELATIVGPMIPRISGYKHNNKQYRSDRINPAKIVDMYMSDKNIKLAAEAIIPIYRKGSSPLPKGVAAFLYYEMAKKTGKDEVSDFMTKLMTGVGITTSDSPILRLREKLDKARRGLLKWKMHEKIEVTINIWNITRSKGLRRVTKTGLSPELGREELLKIQ